MLKELLRKANIYQAELAEKRARLEKNEWELLNARLSLDELNAKQDGRLNADFSMRAHSFYESINTLTERQTALNIEIAELELELETAKTNALEFADKYGVSVRDISVEEDNIVFELAVLYDENRILTALLEEQENLYKAQGILDAARAKIAEPERDEQVNRVQTAYYNAKHALDDFNARAGDQRYITGSGAALADRYNTAKEEYERLLSEYGILHLFSEAELARTGYAAAKARYDKAKADSDLLPLTAPVNGSEKGKGVVTLELLAKNAGSTRPLISSVASVPEKQYQNSDEKQYRSSFDTRNAAPVREAAAYPPAAAQTRSAAPAEDAEIARLRREVEIKRREAQSEISKITADLKAARHEAGLLKREADKARADVMMIKRAKAIAALNVKRSLLAAERSTLVAKAAERELLKGALKNVEAESRNKTNRDDG